MLLYGQGLWEQSLQFIWDLTEKPSHLRTATPGAVVPGATSEVVSECVLSHSVVSDSAAHQVPLSMGYSRQECWSGWPFPSPGDVPDLGIKATSPALASGFFTTEPTSVVEPDDFEAQFQEFLKLPWCLGTRETLLLLVAQSCPTLCNPMDCNLPGSSVHGISQARILEWVAMPSSTEHLPNPGTKLRSPALQEDSLPSEPPGKVRLKVNYSSVSPILGLPGGANGKEPACQVRRCRRRGFDPSQEDPWRRAWRPTPVFLPGESHGQRSLAGCSPWGRRVGHDRATNTTKEIKMVIV